MFRAATIALGLGLGAVLVTPPLLAQSPPATPPPGHQMGHPPGHHMPGHHPSTSTADAPVPPGQDAFGAIAEVVRLLEADPGTDWSRVDLERLRQHLIDMNEVVLRSAVKASSVAGGLAMEITGPAQDRAGHPRHGRAARGRAGSHARMDGPDRGDYGWPPPHGDGADARGREDGRADPRPGLRRAAGAGRPPRSTPPGHGQGRGASGPPPLTRGARAASEGGEARAPQPGAAASVGPALARSTRCFRSPACTRSRGTCLAICLLRGPRSKGEPHEAGHRGNTRIRR